jgi:hypothetical protein
LLKAIVQYGLDNNDSRIEKETIIALPMLFTPEFGRENFFDITQSFLVLLILRYNHLGRVQGHY